MQMQNRFLPVILLCLWFFGCQTDPSPADAPGGFVSIAEVSLQDGRSLSVHPDYSGAVFIDGESVYRWDTGKPYQKSFVTQRHDIRTVSVNYGGVIAMTTSTAVILTQLGGGEVAHDISDVPTDYGNVTGARFAPDRSESLLSIFQHGFDLNVSYARPGWHDRQQKIFRLADAHVAHWYYVMARLQDGTVVIFSIDSPSDFWDVTYPNGELVYSIIDAQWDEEAYDYVSFLHEQGRIGFYSQARHIADTTFTIPHGPTVHRWNPSSDQMLVGFQDGSLRRYAIKEEKRGGFTDARENYFITECQLLDTLASRHTSRILGVGYIKTETDVYIVTLSKELLQVFQGKKEPSSARVM